MRAVIICGGSIDDYNYIKSEIKSDDTIICADAGFIHAVKMGLSPALVVGDFDSVDINHIPHDVRIVRFPAQKDQTDSEIAIEHARKMGFRDFLMIGGIGSRMDHTLANIMLLKDCLNRGEYAEIIDEYNKIMITDSEIKLHELKGTIISLIPLADCYGVTTYDL